MIQLAKDFYIVSIEKNNWTNSRLENNTTYTFKYKNYKLELRPSFDILGYTKEDNMAILNFGYVLEMEKWSNRYLSRHPNLDINKNGWGGMSWAVKSYENQELIDNNEK